MGTRESHTKKQMRLMQWMPEEISLTKRELVRIINAQAHELSAIMGLLDGFDITRDNLSGSPGDYILTPYGRVYAAMRLLCKCGVVDADGDHRDDPDAYQSVVFDALLNKQAADKAEEGVNSEQSAT